MNIKKLSSTVTYFKKTTTHDIEVNGKEIRVYEYMLDDYGGQYEYDYEIDEQDKEKLTDEELEEVEDNLIDLMKN